MYVCTLSLRSDSLTGFEERIWVAEDGVESVSAIDGESD